MQTLPKFYLSNPQSTPTLLYHHTTLNVVMKIIGNGRNAHFLLKSNKEKNDERELVLGKEVYNNVHSHLQSLGIASILDQASNFDKSFSLSFTEAQTTDHMMNEYGEGHVCARLDFDLRKFGAQCRPCMYCDANDVEELSKCFINDYNSVSAINANSTDEEKLSKILTHIYASIDVLSKVFSIKFEDEWAKEREWRYIMFQQTDETLVPIDGTYRLPYDIPLKYLKRIVLLYRDEKTLELLMLRKRLRQWKKWTKCYWIQINVMKFK